MTTPDGFISFTDAVNRALVDLLEHDTSIVCFGLGINDPKRIFGTTKGLVERFGESRVWDTPCSENGLTGAAIGIALTGIPVILIHQRVDFAILSLDQLLNNAAKWKSMFGTRTELPLIVRAIIGQGWGQGPTHSQVLSGMLSSVPGLTVMSPSTPSSVYSTLHEAVSRRVPTVILEHRWLHNTIAESNSIKQPYSGTIVRRLGSDLTIVSYSIGVKQSMQAAVELQSLGITVDVVDVLELTNPDLDLLVESIVKTRRVLFVEIDNHTNSFSKNILVELFSKTNLIQSWEILSPPNVPTPTSEFLTKPFIISAQKIVASVIKLLGIEPHPSPQDISTLPHDIPDETFIGPF